MESLCFKSTLFQIEPGEDSETNPHRYGKQLARWLGDRLAGIGYSRVDVIPEDWGWCVMCQREPFSLWVGCGNSETMETLENPELFKTQPIIWQCFVVAEVPLLKRIIGKPDTTPSESKLHGELTRLLSSEPEIQMVECP